MKQFFKRFGLVLVALPIIYLLHCDSHHKQNNVSDLVFDNIEALASNEAGGGMCFGSGSIDCDGMKVLYIQNAFVNNYYE